MNTLDPIAPGTRTVAPRSSKEAPPSSPVDFRHEFARQTSPLHHPTQPQERTPAEPPVLLGTLSENCPTVSHLLRNHPQYRQECWRIIHSTVNRDKSFHRLTAGSVVHLDPVTHEVLLSPSNRREVETSSPFQHRMPSVAPSATHLAPVPEQSAAAPPVLTGNNSAVPQDPTALHTATRAYYGTDYSRMNCFQLVVQGLKDMGVNYGGKEGLQARMIERARLEGRPANNYLTGEGLIEATGAPVYQEIFEADTPLESQLQRAWPELERRLAPGMILSFSTAQRGHTGVVSRHGDTWTLINSGHIDHDVHATKRRKGVGEEDLRAEVLGWLRLARQRGEPLRLMVGRLSTEKLTAYLDRPFVQSSV